eukprot:1161760-Pelagomonas_calceolata.AAC.7
MHDVLAEHGVCSAIADVRVIWLYLAGTKSLKHVPFQPAPHGLLSVSHLKSFIVKDVHSPFFNCVREPLDVRFTRRLTAQVSLNFALRRSVETGCHWIFVLGGGHRMGAG